MEGSARAGREHDKGGNGAERYGLGLAATYEIDLWGRIEAGTRAAEAEQRAVAADLRTAALSLSLGHVVMGYSLSLISIMGMIALGGIVVNDSLVMIDYANRRRAEGLRALVSIHMAGARRFRPIMLTTMTTFGGLAPMIFETSRQARFMIPMAISLGFGILVATAILLLLVPCVYLILEDLKGLGRIVRPTTPSVDLGVPRV